MRLLACNIQKWKIKKPRIQNMTVYTYECCVKLMKWLKEADLAYVLHWNYLFPNIHESIGLTRHLWIR